MQTTTPVSISASILALCKSIALKAEPRYVEVQPSPKAEPNQCFFNVHDHVARYGGGMVFGWTIWEWPKVYVEAEHHAVWRDTNGYLVDVTPKHDKEERILFLPDAKAKFYVKNPKWRDNVRRSLSADTQVEHFLRVSSEYQRFEIRHSVAVGRVRQIEVPKHLWDRFRELGEARNSALNRLLVALND